MDVIRARKLSLSAAEIASGRHGGSGRTQRGRAATFEARLGTLLALLNRLVSCGGSAESVAREAHPLFAELLWAWEAVAAAEATKAAEEGQLFKNKETRFKSEEVRILAVSLPSIGFTLPLNAVSCSSSLSVFWLLR